jgi:hypothetical protein
MRFATVIPHQDPQQAQVLFEFEATQPESQTRCSHTKLGTETLPYPTALAMLQTLNYPETQQALTDRVTALAPHAAAIASHTRTLLYRPLLLDKKMNLLQSHFNTISGPKLTGFTITLAGEEFTTKPFSYYINEFSGGLYAEEYKRAKEAMHDVKKKVT